MATLIKVNTVTGGEVLINPDFLVGIVGQPPHILVCLSHPIGSGEKLGNVIPVAFDEFKRLEKILASAGEGDNP